MNNWFDQEVVEILDKSYSSRIFPDYELIDFPFATIKTIIDRNSQDKKRAIESIKGIYMLSDTKNGKHYIVFSYGDYGIGSRSSWYCNNGHGDNKELIALVSKAKRRKLCRTEF